MALQKHDRRVVSERRPRIWLKTSFVKGLNRSAPTSDFSGFMQWVSPGFRQPFASLWRIAKSRVHHHRQLRTWVVRAFLAAGSIFITLSLTITRRWPIASAGRESPAPWRPPWPGSP